MSKASDRSIKTAAVNFFFILLVCKSLTNLNNACWVLCLDLKTNWFLERISEVAGHLHMNRFYKNFRYAGKKADWFYDMWTCLFPHFCKVGWWVPLLVWSENVLWQVIKYHNGWIWIMHDLMILVGIPSGQDDDFGLSLEHCHLLAEMKKKFVVL